MHQGKTDTTSKIEQIRTTLNQGIAALAESGQWDRMLDHLAKFRSYSVSNVLLMLAQAPKATRVAGYRKWREMGRQVRKGERGIRIFGYRTHKVRVDDAGRIIEHPEEGEGAEREMAYYPLLSVFDISQTDPIEGFDHPLTTEPKIEGMDDMGVLTRLTEWLEGRGWTVSYQATQGGLHGFTTTDGSRQIVVDRDASPAQKASILLHETAHSILHVPDPASEYVAHRGLKETEAESAAYVVAKMAGLDTYRYSVEYVAGWSNLDPKVLEEAAGNVRRAAAAMSGALGLE